jgi:hypothetical protein
MLSTCTTPPRYQSAGNPPSAAGTPVNWFPLSPNADSAVHAPSAAGTSPVSRLSLRYIPVSLVSAPSAAGTSPDSLLPPSPTSVSQGLTLIHVRAELQQLQDTFMS